MRQQNVLCVKLAILYVVRERLYINYFYQTRSNAIFLPVAVPIEVKIFFYPTLFKITIEQSKL